jgi:hypothetical protein
MLAQATNKLRDWTVAARNNGASDDAIQNRVNQSNKILSRSVLELKTATSQLNAEKSNLVKRGEEVNKLIVGHDEEMTRHRITAHQKRTKYHRTGYMGTAQRG